VESIKQYVFPTVISPVVKKEGSQTRRLVHVSIYACVG
jgi:hypothetical protein